MLVKWDEHFAVGKELDGSQHLILELINQMNHAEDGDIRGIIGGTLTVLEREMPRQFTLEWEMLAERQPDDAAEHQRQHEEFLDALQRIRRHFDAGADVLPDLEATLVAWLSRHQRGTDRDLA